MSYFKHTTFVNKTKTYFLKIIFKEFHIFLCIYLTLVHIFIQNKPCSNQHVLFPKPVLQMMQFYSENTQCIYSKFNA